MNEDACIKLLSAELDAFERAALDFIHERRLAGRDYTAITHELNRGPFAPPPGRDDWDLGATVRAHGIRRP